jgi:hypothetical protein
MPFLAYIAVILVSLGGILFELNWLTSPKLETKPAVQASATAAPPKVAVAPREEESPAPNNFASDDVAAGPRNVAPNVTMVPGGTVTPKAAETQPSEPAPAESPQQTASAPIITPAPVGAASASTNPAASAAETTGAGSADFKREFTTDAKADSTASSASITPAVASATPALASSSNNKCDIAACSAAYQSFRASDCTYQPIDGNARRVCNRTPGGAQQANAHERKVDTAIIRNDAGRNRQNKEAGKEAGLRAFEREVRRITASEANLDPGYDRGYERMDGRSQVIVIERPAW